MIPNQWYVVLESKEVKPGKPLSVVRMGEKLIQGDASIVAYRMRRQALLEMAEKGESPAWQ